MYRADHVGSLLRPKELLDGNKNPDLTPEQRYELENRHILKVLSRQEELGFKIFTDGEFRRHAWQWDFLEGLEGVIAVDGKAASPGSAR